MKYEATQLVKVIDFWRQQALKDDLRVRALIPQIDTKTREIIDIVGPRRSGKSSILKLLIKQLKLTDNFLFINFEDPFFVDHNHPQVIEELISVYQEYFHPKLRYLFFDEIQAINGWEQAVRKLRDGGEFKVYITGSSSKLLSGEISSLLTGRHLSYDLLPLSFPEYLTFKNFEILNKKDLILKKRSLLRHFSQYLSLGGFPEVVKTGHTELLKQYFFDIIQKDIIMRHKIREKGILENMAVYLMSHATKTIPIESLKKTFNISYELASSYLEYLKEGFLVFELRQFSYSLKRQEKAIKKYFAVDCGLANMTSFRFSEDKGRMLENCVYLHLRRMGSEIYYYKTNQNLEVDFYVKAFKTQPALIQVAWSISDDKTRARELRSLVHAMDELKVKQGMILTYNEEEDLVVDGKKIFVKPVYQWLLASKNLP